MYQSYKGIVLAGGTGSRLFPLTTNTSKHLLPIYDKPLIYYSLSILMLAQIKEIVIVVNKNHLSDFKKLLGTGKQLGININFIIQRNPEGIPHALNLCKKIIGKSNILLTLGDNILYGSNFSDLILKTMKNNVGSSIFSYEVANPKRYGVLTRFKNKIKVVEKPKNPKSNKAVVGLYFFDNSVFDKIKKLKKSKRGEYEITDLINNYSIHNSLNNVELNRGFTWIDAGTNESMTLASNHIYNIEKIQSLKISCIEEISFRNKWINKNQLRKLISNYPDSNYKNYLKSII